MIEEYEVKECGKKKNKCYCHVIGLIIGAVLPGIILAALTAVIVLAIVLAILAIIQGILLACTCNKKKCCK